MRSIIMKKVVKFGGSSLANAEQFQKVGDIIRSEESRRYVVPSAPGKRFSADTKVTDLLYACYDKAEAGEDFSDILTEIKSRFYEIIKGLNLDLSLEEEFRQIEADFKAHAGNEYAASRGEFLNGKVMAAYLGYEFIDSATVIRLTKTEISMPIRLTNFLPNDFRNAKELLFQDFMVEWKMELLRRFQEAVLMLQVLWWQKQFMQIFMKTGQMFPDSW